MPDFVPAYLFTTLIPKLSLEINLFENNIEPLSWFGLIFLLGFTNV